jgi:hypothetical protein
MSIEIKIDEATSQKLKAAAARKKLSKEEYILHLIQKALAIEDLNRIRQKLKGVARKSGFKTEQDILDSIS